MTPGAPPDAGVRPLAAARALLSLLCAAAALVAGDAAASGAEACSRTDALHPVQANGADIANVVARFAPCRRGLYHIDLAFEIGRGTDVARLRERLGSSTFNFYSGPGPGCAKLMPGKDGSVADLLEAVRHGRAVKRLVEPGTTIRVDVAVEGDAGAPIWRGRVATAGLIGGGGGYLLREVASFVLQPGVYVIKVGFPDPVDLPPDTRMSLAILLPPGR